MTTRKVRALTVSQSKLSYRLDGQGGTITKQYPKFADFCNDYSALTDNLSQDNAMTLWYAHSAGIEDLDVCREQLLANDELSVLVRISKILRNKHKLTKLQRYVQYEVNNALLYCVLNAMPSDKQDYYRQALYALHSLNRLPKSCAKIVRINEPDDADCYE